MSDRKEFEDWFFSPSNSMSMSDTDVAWEAWQASAILALQKNNSPVQVPMTDEEATTMIRETVRRNTIRRDGSTSLQIVRAVEAHYGITAQCANTTKKEKP